MDNFEAELKDRVKVVNEIINDYMPVKEELNKTVIDAMKYTVDAGGKRIRPLLMWETYKLVSGNNSNDKPDKDSFVTAFMAAIEMIHTYSLIHDDLPALDNDDYRRGRKTAHVVYGEGMAILAGDALLNYAFEVVFEVAKQYSSKVDLVDVSDSRACFELAYNQAKIAKAASILAECAGLYGMIGGQVADVELTGKKLSKEELTYIYENKTGALIIAAMTIGAVLAGADESLIEKIRKVAYNIGMAFQIQDDVLDETATFEELGKPIGSDEESGKVTYVTIHGIDEAKARVKELSDEAITILKDIDEKAEFMESLIDYLVVRKA